MKKNKFLTTGLAIAIFSLSFFVVNLVSARIYNPIDTTNFTNTKSIHEVSEEGLVLGMNFNTETITGSAGSETVLDSSTYNNHGTNSGATHDPDGGFNGGGAFSFDGDNDWMLIMGNTALDLGQTVSWGANFKADTTTNIRNILQNARAFGIKVYGDAVYVGTGDTISNLSTPISTDTWYSVYGTYDGTTMKLYLNGELKDSVALESISYDLTRGLVLSKRDDGNLGYYFNGLIDNIKIYNRALSADEIKAQYLQRAEVGDSYVSQSDVFVDSSGNVGIGTDSPTATLHTIQTATTGNALSVSRDLASASTDSPVVNILQDNAGDDQQVLSVQNDGTGEGLFIDQNGNGVALEIDSEATTQRVIDVEAINTDGDVFSLRNNGVHNDAGNYVFKVVQDQGGSISPVVGVVNDGTGISLYVDTNNAGAYSAIFDGGNVGIGTTSPATLLDVNGIIKTQPASSRTCNALAEGGIMYDSDDSHFYGCNGSSWVQLDN